jgi:hypothetical protein
LRDQQDRPTGRSPDQPDASGTRLESAAVAGESPVREVSRCRCDGLASTAAPVEGRRKLGRPLSKAKYLQRPIADEYREGTVKSTPVRGVKETLKPLTCKQSEGSVREHRLRACLLKNEPASV